MDEPRATTREKPPEPPGRVSVLRADHLVKAYGGRKVVDGVSLEIATGEIVALLGRNGAGKTTTFRMMAGLVRPDGGRLFLDGADISRWPTARRAHSGITYLPQESSVFLRASVAGNLLMILDMAPLPRAGRRNACLRILEELRLAPLAASPAHALSGGERRRLEIARALVLEPRFLLLDEPFTGVDPVTIQDLRKIFVGLAAGGLGLVVSDHNVHDTLSIATRGVVIDEGRVLASGPPAGLAADEKVRRRFLGEGRRNYG